MVAAFEQFLEKHGLALRLKKSDTTLGSSVKEYVHTNVGVQIRCDRGRLLLFISDGCYSGAWYSVPLIRNYLFRDERGTMPFHEAVAFVETNWSLIIDIFKPSISSNTNQALESLQLQQARNKLPIWPDAVLDLEAFLQTQGLSCQFRQAPGGSLGEKCLQYFGAKIRVRVTLKTGWRIEVSDCATTPEVWHDIRLIRMLIIENATFELPFAARFNFVKQNWNKIVDLFNDQLRADTAHRLKLLK